MIRGFARCAVVALLVWLVAAAAAAQSTSTLQGTVSDPGGGILPGVTVTLVSAATGLQRVVVTNEVGVYVFNFLPAGAYRVTAELQGFKAVQRDGIGLDVGQNLRLDLHLEVGDVREVLTVTGEAPLLDTSSPALSTVIEARQLKELPLNGRHWATLMMLAPGAINTGEGNHLSIRFVGRSRDDNNWTFDGVDATGVKDPRQESAARLVISTESVAEFRVNTALYSAETGSAGGGVVQLISKTGTNDFRGTVYDFVRNDKFDSRAFGDEGDPPPFRLNQFGANLGGPVVRQRSFFFMNYEGLRQRQVNTFVGFVPSAAFRANISPGLAQVVRSYPAGTRPTSDPNIDEWNVERRVTSDEDAFLVRLDHRFSDRNSIFGRYNVDVADIVNPTNTGTLSDHIKPENVTIQFQRIIASNLISETRFGYNRSPLNRRREGPATESITVPGFTTLTGPEETVEDGRSYSLLNDMALVAGRHNLKAGVELRRIFVKVGEGSTTSLAYSSRPDFLANSLNSFTVVDFPVREGARWYYIGYVQDDIKLGPNVTINAGLRYEYYTVPNEVEGRERVWNLECGGFCAPGAQWYRPDRNNFAPRVGFAWSPAHFEDRTVVRGGYGVFFGPGQNDDVFAPIDNSGNRLGLTRTDAALTYPIDPFLTLATTSGVTPRSLDPNRRDLYIEHYGLSVQQTLPWRLAVQMGYIGNQGHKLFSRTFVNVIDPALGRRPLPQFGRVDQKDNNGSSSFNGLQVSLRRPFLEGVLIGGQYMWSHSINDGSVGGGEAAAPQNVNDRRADRGSSAQDIRHTATINWVCELPFGPGRRYLTEGGVLPHLLGGWQFAGLLQARTGRQLTVSVTRSSADLPDGNNSGQRPNLVAGVPLEPPGGQTPQQWINPAAFALPVRGTWGNAGRSLLTGPGLLQLDMTLGKRIPLSDTRNLEVRWEIFNVFNRENLANPNTNLSDGPAFGRITGPLNRTFGTGTARQMQFMARLNF